MIHDRAVSSKFIVQEGEEEKGGSGPSSDCNSYAAFQTISRCKSVHRRIASRSRSTSRRISSPNLAQHSHLQPRHQQLPSCSSSRSYSSSDNPNSQLKSRQQQVPSRSSSHSYSSSDNPNSQLQPRHQQRPSRSRSGSHSSSEHLTAQLQPRHHQRPSRSRSGSFSSTDHPTAQLQPRHHQRPSRSRSGSLSSIDRPTAQLQPRQLQLLLQPFACESCDKVFTDPSNLQRHIRSAHVGARSHTCADCGKAFATSSGLKQHQHIHSSVKPFQCEVCMKAYTQFSNLCRHKRMHADCRQQIKCHECGQAFSTTTSLSKHKRFCEGVLHHPHHTSHHPSRLPHLHHPHHQQQIVAGGQHVSTTGDSRYLFSSPMPLGPAKTSSLFQMHSTHLSPKSPAALTAAALMGIYSSANHSLFYSRSPIPPLPPHLPQPPIADLHFDGKRSFDPPLSRNLEQSTLSSPERLLLSDAPHREKNYSHISDRTLEMRKLTENKEKFIGKGKQQEHYYKDDVIYNDDVMSDDASISCESSYRSYSSYEEEEEEENSRNQILSGKKLTQKTVTSRSPVSFSEKTAVDIQESHCKESVRLFDFKKLGASVEASASYNESNSKEKEVTRIKHEGPKLLTADVHQALAKSNFSIGVNEDAAQASSCRLLKEHEKRLLEPSKEPSEYSSERNASQSKKPSLISQSHFDDKSIAHSQDARTNKYSIGIHHSPNKDDLKLFAHFKNVSYTSKSPTIQLQSSSSNGKIDFKKDSLKNNLEFPLDLTTVKLSKSIKGSISIDKELASESINERINHQRQLTHTPKPRQHFPQQTSPSFQNNMFYPPHMALSSLMPNSALLDQIYLRNFQEKANLLGFHEAAAKMLTASAQKYSLHPGFHRLLRPPHVPQGRLVSDLSEHPSARLRYHHMPASIGALSPHAKNSVISSALSNNNCSPYGSSSNCFGRLKDRYSCRFCGKVFPRSANLTRHLRTHTGEQPYKCKYCERSFSISSNLQRHVRNIHNKEKPFKCPLCERCFGQQTNLDRHLKKHELDGGGGLNVIDDSSLAAAAGPVTSSGSKLEEKGDESYFNEIRNFISQAVLSKRGGVGRKEEEEEEEDVDVSVDGEFECGGNERSTASILGLLPHRTNGTGGNLSILSPSASSPSVTIRRRAMYRQLDDADGYHCRDDDDDDEEMSDIVSDMDVVDDDDDDEDYDDDDDVRRDVRDDDVRCNGSHDDNIRRNGINDDDIKCDTRSDDNVVVNDDVRSSVICGDVTNVENDLRNCSSRLWCGKKLLFPPSLVAAADAAVAVAVAANNNNDSFSIGRNRDTISGDVIACRNGITS